MENDGRRVVVHLSDLHFGRDDPRVVDALLDAVHSSSPDVVAVSGDLTQRARRRQFERARAFLDRLPGPQVIVPGNHDIPLFNIAARLVFPLHGYTRHITRDLRPTVSDGPVWITGINTTRPSKWKSGRVDTRTLAQLREALGSTPRDIVRILVAHHPFEKAGSEGPPASLPALTAAGIDVFLTGHLHSSYTGHTAHRYRIAGRTAVVVEAGTAASTRLRNEPNTFNVLRVTSERIDVELRTFDGRRFVPGPTQQFSRTADGWTAT